MVGLTGEESKLTLSFTPTTELEEGSWIRIDVPLLYSSYDSASQEINLVYPNQQEGLGCSSDILGEFDLTDSSPGQVILKSSLFASFSSERIDITCFNWMAPVKSSVELGYFIKTFNQ